MIVASGKGEISRLFERDAARSPFDQPARALALTYVTGMTPYAPFPRVSFNIVPGVGEYFVFPALTTTGPCEIMVFEGVPGGPMDCWSDVRTPDQHLARSKEILQKFMPWEAERCRTVALTDANGILAGRLTPTVRKPVAQLPSGAVVLGMADTVVLNDPITGQGSNNAAKSARIYLKSILDNRDKAFDRAWMQRTFDRLLGLCAMGDRLDQRAADAAAAPRRQYPGRGPDISQDRPGVRQRLRRPPNLLPLARRSRRGGAVHRRRIGVTARARHVGAKRACGRPSRSMRGRRAA